ncbi:hypothetical protein Asppvi_004466 [Aspergillus pseudoviridinutans]|uniref:Uncharacterized protein n=1 Tax=Aspergillus pseudoviridinutans TaxID=1517512 RepID=A0A9P3B6J0_9EURO|nr:uncharacterized protein Asppvi_004466 [Aspergillus pseudoviridinutans]GIJ85607.1 hypothetical protein Asppvi_004466 [Aspergillus pseudoviridinutans]
MTLPASIPWVLRGSDEGAFKSAVTDLYWRSVEEEARHLVVALADLIKDCPEPLAIEKVQARPHRARQNLFAKAWSNVDLDDEALESVRALYGRFSGDDYGKTLIERRARQMLQAVGWLDIDFVHQDRPPIYPSMSGLPNVDELEYGNVIRAMQCSLCRRCIRTQYFECRKGCLDRSSTHNYYKCFPPANEKSQSNISHLLPRLMLTPFRLCFSCMVSTDKIIPDADCTYLRSGYKDRVKQEPHLRSANFTSRRQSPNALAFRRELNALEDFQEG